MNHTTDPNRANQVTAAYDAIVAFQRKANLSSLRLAQIRLSLAEHLADTLLAEQPAAEEQPAKCTCEPAPHRQQDGSYSHWVGCSVADAEQRAAEEQPTETQDSFQVWPLRRVLTEVRCGSQDWTWDEEWADLDRRHAETGYLTKLEQAIRENGITMPVLIGSDGRLWDGHHRLRIAVRLGIDYVPVEITPQSARPAVAEQPDTQTREARAGRCSAVMLRVHHAPHGWEPQPGMDPVHCPGYPQPGKES